MKPYDGRTGLTCITARGPPTAADSGDRPPSRFRLRFPNLGPSPCSPQQGAAAADSGPAFSFRVAEVDGSGRWGRLDTFLAEMLSPGQTAPSGPGAARAGVDDGGEGDGDGGGGEAGDGEASLGGSGGVRGVGGCLSFPSFSSSSASTLLPINAV